MHCCKCESDGIEKNFGSGEDDAIFRKYYDLPIHGDMYQVIMTRVFKLRIGNRTSAGKSRVDVVQSKRLQAFRHQCRGTVLFKTDFLDKII